ncbi:putative polysaccharide biosynthesis protein [Aquibacillus salsiterrae]|uniref:Polysaccharide biosynthesis protein n=1 Tax=Aquibacillus salsiterrae TaxID=2950439 RepID=A0A9X4AFH9_9BACI|nr:polysaccharide biosynthesis protein [Aquibacillus salsiterrae]MDC3417926.1 polysaccharide biosynthesis protein [Aquibacillus salsiterrae]
MGDEQTTRQLYKGALLLTFSGLISKILSAGYRIPLQNITGDLGFYIYQQIYPFLGFAIILSLYGFPTAISKLVAERQEEGKFLSFKGFYIPLLCLLLLINLAFFSGIYFSSHSIAVWMGDRNLQPSIQACAYLFLIIPFTSLLRGTFQGIHNMRPTAISQVVEQLARVSVILLVAITIVWKGKDVYSIGIGAAYGSMIGAALATCVLVVIWVRQNQYEQKIVKPDWVEFGKTILLYGTIISVNHMLLLLLQLADAFTLVPNLVESGLSSLEARKWKGVYDRGFPLVQLGTVVGSSLALALVPSITKHRLERNPPSFYLHIQSALKFSLFLSAGATIGLVGLFPYINVLLYQNEAGTNSLRVLAFAILFTSLITTVATVLQGLGFIYLTACFILLGIGLKWGLNELLIPIYGITGSALATVISLFLVLIVNIYSLSKKLPKWKGSTFPLLAFGIASVSLSLFLWISNNYLFDLLNVHTRIAYFWLVIACTIFGAALYLVVFIRCDGFTDEELNALPFSDLFQDKKV